MFGVCPLFTPTFPNSRLHPNVWDFVLFSPRRSYRAELAATWMPRQQLTGRRSHVAAISAQGKTKKRERERESVRVSPDRRAWESTGGYHCQRYFDGLDRRGCRELAHGGQHRRQRVLAGEGRRRGLPFPAAAETIQLPSPDWPRLRWMSVEKVWAEDRQGKPVPPCVLSLYDFTRLSREKAGGLSKSCSSSAAPCASSSS